MKNRILFTLALVCFLPAMISAQVAVTGKITGVVTDSSGGAVTNATITVKSTALMSPRTISTSSDGAYLFDLLPPGTYDVTVTATGFRTVTQTGAVLTAGFTATVNPKLQVGEVTRQSKCKARRWSTCKTCRPRRPSTKRCYKTFRAAATHGLLSPRCQASPPAHSMWRATIAI